MNDAEVAALLATGALRRVKDGGEEAALETAAQALDKDGFVT